MEFALYNKTPEAWVQCVLQDFDTFLADHGACERKAVSLCLSLTVRYPHKTKLIEPLIALAKEELEHFQDVSRLMNRRGVSFQADRKDPYVAEIQRAMRDGREERLLDTLVASSLIECRGAERFGLLSEALIDPELGGFYRQLAKSEQAHHKVFLKLAELYFDQAEVLATVERFRPIEGNAMATAPLVAALH